MARACLLVSVSLVLCTGCPGSSTSDDGAVGSSSATASTSGGSAGTDQGSQSSTADGSASGESGATTGAGACEDGEMGYLAIAEVLDEGLGPTGAPVTLKNCTEATAYVRQDCCFGAAFFLERKDTPEDPWRMSQPSMDCDCEGFIEPLVIEPGQSMVLETQPASFDAEPLCLDPYSAIYRWTFSMGAQADCTECWEDVPTNDMNWYCEG